MHQVHAVTTEQEADGRVLVEVIVLGDQVGGLTEESKLEKIVVFGIATERKGASGGDDDRAGVEPPHQSLAFFVGDTVFAGDTGSSQHIVQLAQVLPRGDEDAPSAFYGFENKGTAACGGESAADQDVGVHDYPQWGLVRGRHR